MHKTIANFSIQSAVSADVPDILAMIYELAEFERLTLEVKATEQQLREHLFGPQPHAQVLLARVADQPVGFALYFHNYSTFLAKPGVYLEDLYVRLHWRGQGIGTALWQAVRDRALLRGCGRFEWSVLNWNQRAIDFYQKMGAKPMSEWTVYRLSGEALETQKQ